MIATSGSKHQHDQTVPTQQIECDDILAECAGNCGQKILLFKSEARLDGEWKDMAAAHFCIQCSAAMIKQEK